MLTVYHSDGQIKWSYLTSAEESFIIGDQSSSINLLNLSNAANNSGIRLGGMAHINDKLALSGSIGVIGSARLGAFTTNMVPFELTGQYKLAEMDFSTNIPLTWYADASIGSSFVRAQSTNYNVGGYNSLSENFSLGASLDLIQWNGGIVAIGYRHTFFNDDNIDALNENRSFDQLSRWYTSYRIDLAGVEMQGHSLRFANGPFGWYTSVEESFIIGDRISSINPLNLSNAANNAGIRIGMYQFFSNKLWAEATLGVIGSAKLGSFSTKLVPVEIIGHYNVYSNPINDKMPMNWYADLGAGMSFVRAKSENYNTAGYNSSSPNLSLGASLDLLQFQGQTLAIGYRHSIFGDDNIDALNELGGRDQLSRWFTSFRIDLNVANHSQAKKESLISSEYNLNHRTDEFQKDIITNIETLQGISKDRFDDGNASEHSREGKIFENSNTTSDSEIFLSQTKDAEIPESFQILVQNIARVKFEIEMLRNSEKSSLYDKRFAGSDSSQYFKFSEELDSLVKLLSNFIDEYGFITFETNTKNSNAEQPIMHKKHNSNLQKKGELNYAVVLKTFDSLQEAQDFIEEISPSLENPFIWEVSPLRKYRVVLGVYSSINEREQKVEELRNFGYSPWVTIWND
jgi:hypothetical protein